MVDKLHQLVGKPWPVKTPTHPSDGTPSNMPSLTNRAEIDIVLVVVESTKEVLNII